MSLDALQVENEADPDYVPNGDEPLDDIIPGGISPTLTIWRKLHLEVDSMEEVPEEGSMKNWYAGMVTGFMGVDEDHHPPRTTLRVSNAPGPQNRFQAGRLILNGQEFFVRSSKQSSQFTIQGQPQHLFAPQIVIDGILDSSVTGMSYILNDDDDLHRDELGLHPSLPYNEHSGEIVEAIRPKFWPAFIEIVDANDLGLNDENPTIPFKLNEGVSNWPGTHLDSHANAKDVQDSHSFWAHTLIIAYQPAPKYDNDPGRLPIDYGGTPKWPWFNLFRSWGYSVIFVEIPRDVVLIGSYPVSHQFGPASAETLPLEIQGLFHGTIAHEIAHSPGKQHPDISFPGHPSDHSEDGLMRAEPAPTLADDFTPPSIRRFRSVNSWQN